MAPANLTKLVADKLKRGEDRKHDLAVHGAPLAARVAEALRRPELERPLAALLAEADLAREHNDGHLRQADQTYIAEQSDDVVVRAQRGDAESALYSTLTGARSLVGAVHGPAQVRAVGFVGETPTDLAQLIRLAPVIASGLRKLPEPPSDSRVLLDVDGMSADLEKAAARAQEALTATNSDLRENEAALRARNDALTVAHRSQVFLGELMRLCAMTVGDEDLQHRLRDRPLSSTAEPEPEPEATPAAG